jgi:hypothetical protein
MKTKSMKRTQPKTWRLVRGTAAELVLAANEALKTLPEVYAHEGFNIGFTPQGLSHSPAFVKLSVRTYALPGVPRAGEQDATLAARRDEARKAFLEHARHAVRNHVGTSTDGNGDVYITGLIKFC